ncbi:hypothetical protein GCM10023167_09190 [Brevibacterium pityocampae]|uniref:Uncharacterized protein n=1 Tax=Brevibacterium pityocampae TaxID=506594 RepID=A0ABP8J7E0_9MICO
MAGASAAKMPAPIIDPSPMITASPRPRVRDSAAPGWEAALVRAGGRSGEEPEGGGG